MPGSQQLLALPMPRGVVQAAQAAEAAAAGREDRPSLAAAA